MLAIDERAADRPDPHAYLRKPASSLSQSKVAVKELGGCDGYEWTLEPPE
jgi:hypothetical protein